MTARAIAAGMGAAVGAVVRWHPGAPRARGSWSRWQGEGSEWTDTIVPLTARQAVEAIDADKVIARLTERLERYLAHPTEPIVTDAERARDRFRAALAVLKEAAR
jgi:hypothetical protein